MRSWVEISRNQLAANFAALRAAVGPEVEVACVVKANAYGHGAVEVARVLEAEGARWLAVAAAEEGVELRQARVWIQPEDCPSASPPAEVAENNRCGKSGLCPLDRGSLCWCNITTEPHAEAYGFP